jgi:hypothetical protein
MIVVQGLHEDKNGAPCRGAGRGIAKWPLRVELRMIDGGGAYALEVIDGPTFQLPSRATLEAKLVDIGASPEDAMRRAHEVSVESSVVFDIEGNGSGS